MLSDDRPSNLSIQNYGNQRDQRGQNNKRTSNEETIKLEKIQIERKSFVIALKENARGRFMRITEDVGGRRDTVIVPSTGLEEFRDVIEAMVEANDDHDARQAEAENKCD